LKSKNQTKNPLKHYPIDTSGESKTVSETPFQSTFIVSSEVAVLACTIPESSETATVSAVSVI